MKFTLVIASILLCQCLAESHPWDPQPRDAGWLKRHEKLLEQTRLHKTDEQLVFVGDSITEGWAGNGHNVWAQHYTPRHAYNYGIGGDRTEHVIYRIQNKEFDELKPKVTVLMIGTNNIASNTIEDIAHGVNETVRELLGKMPETKLILLGVLPRAEPLGTKCKQLNTLIKKLDNQKNVFWHDMWLDFESADGKQKTDLYVSDKLHLNEKGYQVWQQSTEALISKLFK
ncbi:platelet-activating factor acetylhydrolase IB subunit alpha2-like [Oppia nitens]|uniref:platelet-activating factor acetylhydrolase IB subunit alpha2-like n=1 Tax=Oppia nitens TaxID=1686743 RepID=UPI0023DA1A94|nr:platelet-activating factor acetylhydrolase IB subunit alpha2-like [Oppia nitens]